MRRVRPSRRGEIINYRIFSILENQEKFLAVHECKNLWPPHIFSLPISLKSSLLSKSAISILKKPFSSPQANDNIPGSKCSWTLSCKTKGHRFLIDIPTYFLPRASSLEPIPSDSPTELAPTSLWLSWFDNQHQRHFKVSINLAWSIPKRISNMRAYNWEAVMVRSEIEYFHFRDG